jgi:hypothetical protein
MRLAARLRRSRHGIYYFRLIIPKTLRPLFAGRREAQGSLGTADRQRAVLAAHLFSAQALVVFAGLESAMASDSKNDKRGSLPAAPFSIKRVAFDGPNRKVTDGPFAHPRELVAGFWIWEVKDMDEAVAWVKRCPNPHPEPCEIEIRPFYEIADLQPTKGNGND